MAPASTVTRITTLPLLFSPGSGCGRLPTSPRGPAAPLSSWSRPSGFSPGPFPEALSSPRGPAGFPALSGSSAPPRFILKSAFGFGSASPRPARGLGHLLHGCSLIVHARLVATFTGGWRLGTAVR